MGSALSAVWGTGTVGSSFVDPLQAHKDLLAALDAQRKAEADEAASAMAARDVTWRLAREAWGSMATEREKSPETEREEHVEGLGDTLASSSCESALEGTARATLGHDAEAVDPLLDSLRREFPLATAALAAGASTTQSDGDADGRDLTHLAHEAWGEGRREENGRGEDHGPEDRNTETIERDSLSLPSSSSTSPGTRERAGHPTPGLESRQVPMGLRPPSRVAGETSSRQSLQHYQELYREMTRSPQSTVSSGPHTAPQPSRSESPPRPVARSLDSSLVEAAELSQGVGALRLSGPLSELAEPEEDVVVSWLSGDDAGDDAVAVVHGDTDHGVAEAEGEQDEVPMPSSLDVSALLRSLDYPLAASDAAVDRLLSFGGSRRTGADASEQQNTP